MGDPVSLIMAALVAGAAKTAGEAVQDAYKGLRQKLRIDKEGFVWGQSEHGIARLSRMNWRMTGINNSLES